jgi:plasmid stabilization system protein ParE
MSWTVVVRPEASDDVTQAADWYDERQEGLGDQFVEEVLRVYDALAINPHLNSRRDLRKNVRWRFPDRFPYRVVYEIIDAENVVVIAAVIHAAREDRHWQKRIQG